LSSALQEEGQLLRTRRGVPISRTYIRDDKQYPARDQI
jgi:hypothetical protein